MAQDQISKRKSKTRPVALIHRRRSVKAPSRRQTNAVQRPVDRTPPAEVLAEPMIGPPRPAAVVWVEDSWLPDAVPFTLDAALEREVVKPRPLPEPIVVVEPAPRATDDATVPDSPPAAVLPAAGESPAVAFDAAGNLILDPSARGSRGVVNSLGPGWGVDPTQENERAEASEFILPPPKPTSDQIAVEAMELTPLSADAPITSTEPEDPWEEIDADAPQTLPSPTVAAQGTPPLENVQRLTVVGLLRMALWPFRALYWPMRLRHLERQRGQLQHHYASSNGTTDDARAVEAPSSLTLRMVRVTVGFIAVCVVMLLPIQIAVYTQAVSDASDRLLDASQAAIAALRTGRDKLFNFHWLAATDSFHQAEAHFRRARDEYDRLDPVTKALLQTLPQGRKTLAAGMSLLTAGENLAEMANSFSSRVSSVTRDSGWLHWQGLLPAVAELETDLTRVLPLVAHAKTALAEIKLAQLPPANRESFLAATRSLPDLESTLLDASAVTRSILRALGVGGWQRYLVLLQNNHELRATGGFLGSFAIVDVQDGQITNLSLPGGGSYDLQGSLLALVQAPIPLRLINPRWEFQDANWWPDFPVTARKAAWFLEESRGPSVDGVVSLTNSVVERLLALSGPITLPQSGRVLDVNNFTREAQTLAEFDYDTTANRPKQFLADLAPLLLARLQALPPERQADLWETLYQLVKEKQLMVWSAEPQTQELLQNLDWAGHLQPVGLSDYLMVVNSNIAGGKTDAVIATSFHHAVTVESDGRLLVTLQISRTHQGTPGDAFTGASNNSYARVYVPGGSQLISARGFVVPKGAVEQSSDARLTPDGDLAAIEGVHAVDPRSGVEIYQELGKTVFAHWVTVKPGEQKTVQLAYRLPFTLAEANHAYTLMAQKQPGSLGDELLSTFTVPAGWDLEQSYPAAGSERLKHANQHVQFHDRLITDAFYGVRLRAEKSEPNKP